MKKLNLFLLCILFSLLIFTLTFNPRIDLEVKNKIRSYRGLNSMVNPSHPIIIKWAEEVKERNINIWNIREFIYEKLPYKNDWEFSMWWNLDFTASLDESLRKGYIDCEENSIFTKSISLALSKDKEYLESQRLKKVIPTINFQQGHIFNKINNISIGYIEGLDEEITRWEIFKENFYIIQPIRRLFIVCGLIIIWLLFFIKLFKKEVKNERIL